MHAHANIHLHPDMKIIKIKASDIYGKNSNKYDYTNERGNFWLFILPKSDLNLHIFIHMHCIIKIKTMDLHL